MMGDKEGKENCVSSLANISIQSHHLQLTQETEKLSSQKQPVDQGGNTPFSAENGQVHCWREEIDNHALCVSFPRFIANFLN